MEFPLGIVSVDALGEAHFACGCSATDGFIGYRLMCALGCFDAHVDARLKQEHDATHKRQRKACKYCNGRG